MTTTSATIRLLDPHLAAKIAAGEVVERPASVVKELVENSIDAGARRITVEVDAGGMDHIRVTDDGCGIPPAEVELAFRRHATSKLVTEADLDRLATLGFRGEALPSIAAVADVVCWTRVAEERAGVEVQIEQGSIARQPIARQPGTTLQVDGLFARFPARRKFLRSRATEGAACVAAVTPLALAFPEIAFVVQLGGREALRTTGEGDLLEAAAAVLGAEARAHLLPLAEDVVLDEAGTSVVRVRGICATGGYTRAARSGLFLSVNRRPMQNRSLAFAVVEAYGSLVQVGRQPVAVILIDVPPNEVDFNVHPSKLEVKLLRERAIYAAVQRALRATLASGGWQVGKWAGDASAAPAGANPEAPASSRPSEWQTAAAAAPLGAESGAPDQAEHLHLHRHPGTEQPLLGDGERLEDLRIIGQACGTYIIAEGDAGVYLVDQHAAHERVLLERLREQLGHRPDKQLLLEPLVLDVPASAVPLLESQRDGFAALGFDAQPFGPCQVLVRAVPAVLADRRPEHVLSLTLTALATNTHGLVIEEHASWTERLALVLACKTAVKAGDSLQTREMAALLRRLGEARLCRTCAHGRPTAILLSSGQLEREFGRR